MNRFEHGLRCLLGGLGIIGVELPMGYRLSFYAMLCYGLRICYISSDRPTIALDNDGGGSGGSGREG